MLDIADIPKILEAYSKIKPENLLNRFSYEHTLIFNRASVNVVKDWLYIMEGKKLYWSPIYLPDPERNPDDFLEFAKTNHIVISEIAMLKTQKSDVLDSKYIPKKYGSHVIYIYDNNNDMLNSYGKDYERFRVARKYVNDPDFTVDIYDRNNLIPLSVFNEINEVVEVWKDYEESKGFSVNYRPIRLTENLMKYGQDIDFVTMITRYKGQIVNYFTSERLNSNYVILADGKFNFAVDKEVERKFQYVVHLQHWMHIAYWNGLPHDFEKPIYYNIGMSGPDSYKNRLRPVYKLEEYRYKVREDFKIVEQSNELF